MVAEARDSPILRRESAGSCEYAFPCSSDARSSTRALAVDPPLGLSRRVLGHGAHQMLRGGGDCASAGGRAAQVQVFAANTSRSAHR